VDQDFSDQSLYRVLEERPGVVISRGRRSVEAALASDHVAKLLGIASGAPVMVLRCVSHDNRDRPVETFVAYHRSDRSRFEVDLGRASAGPVTSRVLVTRNHA
jgi:GntR family transcriptional regulator